MYHPLTDLSPLAAALDAAMTHGDTSALSARILATMAYATLDDALRANFTAASLPVDAFAGISCADAVVDLASRTLDDWQAALDRYSDMSRVAGPWVLYMQTLCAGWPLRSEWQFPRGGPGEGRRAAAPILFLSNRWDPVTPAPRREDRARCVSGRRAGGAGDHGPLRDAGRHGTLREGCRGRVFRYRRRARGGSDV
ncbi:Peptidase S33 tripeptidyl aminopeptidase-lik [Akanthomyces lecanii RCEF 1005]|uniref:Peptidase S33 tripeptidyl aminopeptidase-lik n=1 Tax=Akanthomyces lecanii RCEF 1005 TaxID=1081108 RepID=A0A168KU44_CORDF|nr:Peptidase S33 tripeptidyl aminopeptidase-lik [Akanthomyces lecanii RCEF 1005]